MFAISRIFKVTYVEDGLLQSTSESIFYFMILNKINVF